MGIAPQGLPLPEEKQLQKGVERGVVRQQSAAALHGLRFPAADIPGPVFQFRAAEVVPQSHKQGKIRQPAALLRQKILKRGGIPRSGPVPRLPQQGRAAVVEQA